MKKHFFWLALGAATLSACTSTDVVEEGAQSNAIGFENIIYKPVRDAQDPVSGDLNSSNFNKFVVFGYYTKDGMEAHPISVFDGVEVTKDGEAWTYKGTRYWNINSTYYFYAYSCADIALSDEKGKAEMILTGSDVKARALRINDYYCNAEHQHDLICDAAETISSKTSGNSKVKFSFKHALCKVSAEFVNDFPEMYDVYISDVKLVNFYDKSSVIVTDNQLEWGEGHRASATSPSIDMKINGSNKATSTEAFGENAEKVAIDPVFMLPVNYNNANVRFEFTLTVKQGDDTFLERTIKGTFTPDWAYGKQYKYVIHITGATAQLEAIEFEAKHEISDMTTPDGWSGEITTDMSFSM